ncbi:MAG: hypothetical protein AAF479_15955 [Pseudomonadota bacterium]
MTSALQQEIAEAVAAAIEPLEAKIDDLTHKIAAQNGEHQDRWVSVTEAARLARRDEKTIRRWITEGQVQTRRIGPRGGRIQILERTPAD